MTKSTGVSQINLVSHSQHLSAVAFPPPSFLLHLWWLPLLTLTVGEQRTESCQRHSLVVMFSCAASLSWTRIKFRLTLVTQPRIQSYASYLVATSLKGQLSPLLGTFPTLGGKLDWDQRFKISDETNFWQISTCLSFVFITVSKKLNSLSRSAASWD